MDSRRRHRRRRRQLKRIGILCILSVCLLLCACFSSGKWPPGFRDLLPFFSTEEYQEAELAYPDEEYTETDAQAADSPAEESGSRPGWKKSVSELLREIPGISEYMENLPEGSSLFRNEAPSFYYYGQLNAEEQALYQAMLAVVQDPTSTEYRKKVQVLEDPSSDYFEMEITHAMHALENDHPELFWLRQNGSFRYYYLDRTNRSGEYSLMVQLSEVYENYEEEMTAFNNAVSDFMADIDLSAPDPLVALAIHDKLIDMVSYDEVLAGDNSEEDISDYGYTAYGALVENSRAEAHTAVCDGYTYAFQYLLQQAGIEAVRVAGYAGDSPETAGGHSWNVIRLDDGWYEVDATWDDNNPGFDQEDPDNWLLNAAVSDWDYWDRIRHYMYGLTTDEISWYVPDDSLTYYYESESWTGHASFLSSSVHIRDTEEQQGETHDYITYLAPLANGTLYTYDYLINMRWEWLQAQNSGQTQEDVPESGSPEEWQDGEG